MSVARPAARRLLASGCLPGAAAPSPSCRQILPAVHSSSFHTSSQLEARRRSRFSSIPAAKMGLIKEDGEFNEANLNKFIKKKLGPKFTPEEMVELSKRYSPEQIAAIEAGEAAINPVDLTIQGRLRDDPYAMAYLDDFAEHQPIIDKRPQKHAPPDPEARFMNLDEFTEDLIQWADQFRVGDVTGTMKKVVDFVPDQWKKVAEGKWPGDVRDQAHKDFKAYLQDQVDNEAKNKSAEESASGPTDADVLQYILERSSMTDGNLKSNSSLAPALPRKVPGVAGLYSSNVDPEDEGLDPTGIYQDLKKRTGMSVREILELRAVKLVHRFVSNQTRLGKIQSSSVMFCAGNGKGWLGIGMAKSTEPAIASSKARLLAIRNMQPIRRYENRTIYGNLTAKVSGTVVELSARPPGFGLRVQHRIFEMCRAAGIHDLAARVPRSRNPMNTVKATYEALCNQKDPEQIAIGRGKKLVDVRKVYYGGSVY
ncbi:ribosomal protein S5, C-terminal domain-containing protein [Cladorrhinum sp. PSN259]|nr:ribosomal protein S5, C-terminal domain-containing protein [Cladorrhinum sp. PSN259]